MLFTSQGLDGGLYAEMRRMLAPDPGTALLARHARSRTLTLAEEKRQHAWARAVVTLVGHDDAARALLAYAATRQQEMEPLTDWRELAVAAAPVPPWECDRHGFLCVGCGDAFAQVEHSGDGFCAPCVRRFEEASPADVRPLWRPTAWAVFETPGRPTTAPPPTPDTIQVRFSSDGEERSYTAGHLRLFVPETGGLPGLDPAPFPMQGASRDRITATVTTTARYGDRSCEISAVLDHDPAPDEHGYAKGFGIRAGRVTLPGGAPREYTGPYALIGAVIDALHPAEETTEEAAEAAGEGEPKAEEGAGQSAAPERAPRGRQAPTEDAETDPSEEKTTTMQRYAPVIGLAILTVMLVAAPLAGWVSGLYAVASLSLAVAAGALLVLGAAKIGGNRED